MSFGDRIRELVLGTNPPLQPFDSTMKRLLTEFQDDRANALAQSIHGRATAGAELAMAQQDLRKWMAYAKALEKKLLSCGCELPKAPDEQD